MAEELRLFLRSLVYLVPATIVYWLVGEAAGITLMVFLVLATVAFVAVGTWLAPKALAGLRRRSGLPGPLGALNRTIGFDEPPDARSPLEARSELVPLASPWPILAAASIVVVGVGLIFGAWLLLPGLVLLAATGLGWVTQLDRA